MSQYKDGDDLDQRGTRGGVRQMDVACVVEVKARGWNEWVGQNMEFLSPKLPSQGWQEM